MEWIWYIIAALGAGIGTGLAGLSAATVMVPILIVLCPSFAGETGFVGTGGGMMTLVEHESCRGSDPHVGHRHDSFCDTIDTADNAIVSGALITPLFNATNIMEFKNYDDHRP